jgi:hypothetical protein
MSKSNTFENDWLKLIFNAIAIATLADNAASTPLTNLYVGLHTADPGEAGNQTTNECAYTSYARVAVARTTGGWTVSGNTVTNAAAVTFPKATGGSETATYFTVGSDPTGTGKILYYGVLGGSLLAFTGKASNDTLTIPGHNFIANDQVVAYPAPGATLPTGVTEGTVYFVKTVSGNDVTLSATQGGSTLDLTADGAGIIQKLSSLAISNNVQPEIAIGSLSISED